MEKDRCMTDGEIVTSYKQARFPKRQITILSQLNCMKRQEIKDILTKAGCNLNKPTPKKKVHLNADSVVRQVIDWERVEPELIELYYDGYTYVEIAEILSISTASISKRITMLENQEKIVRR